MVTENPVVDDSVGGILTEKEEEKYQVKNIIYLLESSVALQGLLSRTCRGLGPFGSKGDFAGRSDERF